MEKAQRFIRTGLTIISLLLFLILPVHAAEKQDRFVFHSAMESPIKEILAGRIKEAFHRMDLQAELMINPSSQRALLLANQEGDGDAARVPEINELAPQDTANLIMVPEAIITMELTVYTNGMDFVVEDWPSLAHYHNGARIGAKILEKNLPGQRTFLPTTVQLLHMLATGRIDTMVEWNLVADKSIRDLHLTTIKKLSPSLHSQSLHIYLHKKHQALVPLLNQTLSQMKEDGTFEKIALDILHPPVEKIEYVFYTGAPTPLREIAGERLREACRRIGKKCSISVTGSAARSLLTANTEGDGDLCRVGDLHDIVPEESANLVIIPEAIINTEFRAYSKGKIFPVDGWESLRQYHNGFRGGVKILEKNIPGQRMVLPDADRLFQMLDQERLDTVIEHNYVADLLIAQQHLSNITKLAPPLKKAPMYSYIHRDHQTLIPDLAKALATMKEDGTFQQIEIDVLQKLTNQEQ